MGDFEGNVTLMFLGLFVHVHGFLYIYTYFNLEASSPLDD